MQSQSRCNAEEEHRHLGLGLGLGRESGTPSSVPSVPGALGLRSHKTPRSRPAGLVYLVDEWKLLGDGKQGGRRTGEKVRQRAGKFARGFLECEILKSTAGHKHRRLVMHFYLSRHWQLPGDGSTCNRVIGNPFACRLMSATVETILFCISVSPVGIGLCSKGRKQEEHSARPCRVFLHRSSSQLRAICNLHPEQQLEGDERDGGTTNAPPTSHECVSIPDLRLGISCRYIHVHLPVHRLIIHLHVRTHVRIRR